MRPPLILPLAAAVALVGSACTHGFLARPQVAPASAWQDLGVPPGGAEHYPPQGMTLVGDRLGFTNHHNDTKSAMYLVDTATMTIQASAEMPPEAVHTSGLGWDGQTLWAVDYKSLQLYALDLEATFDQGQAAVTGSWPTGLEGASALTVVELDGVIYLAISDFMRTARTYLIQRDRVSQLDPDHPLPDLASVSYRNGTFSQGLTWDGRYLYETVNNRGVDRIEVYDIATALRAQDSNQVLRVGSFEAPGRAGEDLATDGQRLWTSDEASYRWYVLRDLPGTIALLEGAAD